MKLAGQKRGGLPWAILRFLKWDSREWKHFQGCMKGNNRSLTM